MTRGARKTCECCKRRLKPPEHYWCASCRSAIGTAFRAATMVADRRMRDVPHEKRREEAEKIAEEMIRTLKDFV
jgi:hypothetical protein